MTKVFAEIRKSPVYTKKAKKNIKSEDRKHKGAKRLTLAERKKNVAKKIKSMFKKAAAKK